MKKKFLYFLINLFFFVYLIFSLQTPVFADSLKIDKSINLTHPKVIETSSSSSTEPNINARHAVILDRFSKQIIYGKKENEKCKMASTTKIMTCLVALENSSLSDDVIISKRAASIHGSRLGLSENDKISFKHLLYGLMLCSGNDAAIAIAEHVGGSVENFVKIMNKKATNLNLSSTNFVTPHGLDDDNHYTTAYDLAILTNYALNNKTFFKIVSTKYYTVNINGKSKDISNTNELLGNYNGIYGVKTGFTNGANRCLVTACKQNDLDIICIVLGCDTKKNRTQDSIKLLNYVFNNYSMIDIEQILESNFNKWYVLHKLSFNINKGISNLLELKIDKSKLPFSKMAIKKTDINNFETTIEIESYIESPVYPNKKIGDIKLVFDKKDLISLDIVNINLVNRKNIFLYFKYMLSNYSTYFKNDI